MEKKLKYLFVFLIAGIGLVSNQTFADFFVDTVTQGDLSSTSRSASYSYQFKLDYHLRGTGEPKTCMFGYRQYYNGSYQYSYFGVGNTQAYTCVTPWEVPLSNSYFGGSLYTGGCLTYVNRVHYADRSNCSQIGYNDSSKQTIVLLGRGNNAGKVFTTVQNDDYAPHYGFGGGYFVNNDWIELSPYTYNYLRLFYTGHKENGSWVNPVDGFNIGTMLGSSQQDSYAWEYFYPKGTRTSYGYIVDDGQTYTKYKHYGLFEMGYSYVYGKVSQSQTTLTWDQLGFNTVADDIKTYVKIMGQSSFSDTLNYSYPGLLTFRANSYVSFGNDDGIYVLQKDSTDHTRIMYEHWSCNYTNLQVVASGGTSNFGCVKLDGGYLSRNGSTSVMGYTSNDTVLSITGSTADNDFVYCAINGGNGITQMMGYTNSNSNGLYINGCLFNLIGDSSVDILGSYEFSNTSSGGGGSGSTSSGSNITSQELNMQIASRCLNDELFAMSNAIMCRAYINLMSNTVALGSGYYYQYSVNANGDPVIEIIDQASLFDNITGDVWIQDSNGNWVTNCDGGWCNPNEFENDGTDLTGLSYRFENFFDSGFLFDCPFPYQNELKKMVVKGKEIFYSSIGNDFMKPIYCMSAGFREGKKTNIFSTISNPLSSRLLDSSDFQGLYNLFDIILSLGIMFIVFRIYNLIK